jgi:hypothetical protein
MWEPILKPLWIESPLMMIHYIFTQWKDHMTCRHMWNLHWSGASWRYQVLLFVPNPCIFHLDLQSRMGNLHWGHGKGFTSVSTEIGARVGKLWFRCLCSWNFGLQNCVGYDPRVTERWRQRVCCKRGKSRSEKEQEVNLSSISGHDLNINCWWLRCFSHFKLALVPPVECI